MEGDQSSIRVVERSSAFFPITLVIWLLVKGVAKKLLDGRVLKGVQELKVVRIKESFQ